MKRYPAYDPPEYVSWSPDPRLVAEFAATLRRDPERWALIEALDEEFLLKLYAGLLRARLHDITLKRWVRTGVISKAWLGTGEEAATVGPVHALDRARDIVAPMIRNAGACAEMGMSVADSFRSYLATADSPSGGRDLHHGSMRWNVLQPISHVGDMVPVIAGIALAAKLRGPGVGDRGSGLPVALTWIGDGSTKAAAAHEGLNFAAVQKVPAIYVVQNNQVALGTRVTQHHLPGHFDDLPFAYGMWGASFDGNNVLDGWAATSLAVSRCRADRGPAMLVANTFRMGGHATHDEREARETFPAEWFAEWGRRDPIGLYEEYLKARLQDAGDRLQEVEAAVEAEILAAEQEALRSREQAIPQPATAVLGVYAE
ncbi:MAG TPA: thiamine pyrophosphate-dependent enzyme [Gemmatimonadales bacterium]|nr:thiamine pyrophosphate-dependent enzyme [Gemmatimonadales bacterium]